MGMNHMAGADFELHVLTHYSASSKYEAIKNILKSAAAEIQLLSAANSVSCVITTIDHAEEEAAKQALLTFLQDRLSEADFKTYMTM